MPTPNANARTMLDHCSQALAATGQSKQLYLTIDDFNPQKIAQAARAERNIRASLIMWTIFLLSIAFGVLVYAVFREPQPPGSSVGFSPKVLLAGIWFFAMGGLGAVLNLFSVYLRMLPSETLRENDTFVVNGRALLGCLFSFVLSLTVLASEVTVFFDEVLAGTTPKGGFGLLIPFGLGYAVPFALSMMQRLIRSLEFVFGISDGGARNLKRPGPMN